MHRSLLLISVTFAETPDNTLKIYPFFNPELTENHGNIMVYRSQRIFPGGRPRFSVSEGGTHSNEKLIFIAIPWPITKN
jgi:hypothetical protein